MCVSTALLCCQRKSRGEEIENDCVRNIADSGDAWITASAVFFPPFSNSSSKKKSKKNSQFLNLADFLSQYANNKAEESGGEPNDW